LIRQMAELEGPGQRPDRVGPFAQHVGERPTDVLVAPEREDPVRLVVHERHRAVAPYGDHSVAHAVDDVPEEPIVGHQRVPRRCGPHRRWDGAPLGCRGSLGHGWHLLAAFRRQPAGAKRMPRRHRRLEREKIRVFRRLQALGTRQS
jgi:hypothetical protein